MTFVKLVKKIHALNIRKETKAYCKTYNKIRMNIVVSILLLLWCKKFKLLLEGQNQKKKLHDFSWKQKEIKKTRGIYRKYI